MLIFSLLAISNGFAEQKLVSVRTLGVDGVDLPEWYISVDDNKFEPLIWSDKQPSSSMMTQVTDDLQLYSKVNKPNGESVYNPVRKVELPKEGNEVLLLGWLPVDEEQAKLIAVSDTFKNAKFNDWIVINTTEQEVNLRFGKDAEAITLLAGETKIYKIESEVDKGAEAIAQAMHKDEMKTIYSTFWSASSDQRSLILFYSIDDRVKLRKIHDIFPK